ncbi:hypothetical protein [Pontibacter sp. SGAir0037]|uniref:hypothetical protein n=1 Tax=Pontibacter sp. SGAir0037 TaxID=2571030 RepID=UPI0010CCDCFB|nr:hypothetical protein [Pontibacter sp. SGAir0037]QCR24457.1 hypothetical protein C1N53_20235 [Pontibacter sp. SGAir0037]
MTQLFTIYVYLQSLICGCSGDRWHSDFVRLRKDYKVKVQRIATVDEGILESSGLAHASDSTFWTHGDSGLKSDLFLTNLKGDLLDVVSLPVSNYDWEDLAKDKAGNLYIGDFGNNANTRTDLRVYKVQAGTMAVTDTINFRFADQEVFPPPFRKRHYDLEAFFYRSDSLYLFSKSRALFKPITRLYKMPAQAGEYDVQPQEELRLQSPVTAADIAPAEDAFALLGYGRLYLFKPASAAGKVNFNGKRYCLPIGRTGQAEAVLYLSPGQLLVSNERGKLYLVTFAPRHQN